MYYRNNYTKKIKYFNLKKKKFIMKKICKKFDFLNIDFILYYIIFCVILLFNKIYLYIKCNYLFHFVLNIK